MDHFKLWSCAKLIQWMHKICDFSYVEQLYKQSMYVSSARPSVLCVTLFQAVYNRIFIPNSWNFRKHWMCGKKQDFLFLDTSNWSNCAPVVTKRPLPGIISIALYTLDKWIFKIYLICGHFHQILAIWWLENGTNWWFLTIIWGTDHGIHFIYGVYTS